MNRIALLALSLALGDSLTAQDAEREPAPQVDFTRFEATKLATGLDRPMELTVAPDGRVFWIELAGKLRIFDPTTGVVEEAATLDVFVEQENGLLGIALAPDFASSQQIYLLYSPPEYPGQHLSRFRMNGNRLDLDSEQLILKFEEQRRECCHHAGSLEFDADGNLFIATGDNTHPHGDSQGYAPIDEREGREPWDAQKGPANTQSLSGKVLRIRPTAEGYEIPAGNLFADPTEGRPEIYVMGCRNPWRIGVDQKTGYVYWGDVGPDAGGNGARGPRGYDEINQARQAGNFGWPYLIADNQAYHDVNFETGEVGDAYDAAGPTNASPNNTGARVLPPAQPAWIYYPYGDSDRFPELNAPGGRTACAGPIYDFDADLESATKFPAHFDRCFFAFEWSRHWITAVHLDEDSNIKRLERFLPDHAFKRPVDLEFGPEGSLYLLEYGTTWGTNEDSALVRIDYFAGNRAPRAEIALSDAVGTAPRVVTASAAGTLDPDGDALEYVWRIAGSSEVLSRAANPTLTFEDDGVFQLELEVTDPSGARASAVSPVLVGNTPPRITIDAPRDGDFFQPGQAIAWKVTASDAEDGHASQKTELAARVALEVQWHDGAMPSALGEAEDRAQPGREAMKRSDCFNCHAIDRKVIGPTLLEIAGKYREQEGALELLAQRVREGSSGVWGQVPMLPHPQHSEAEAKQMVSWILALSQDGPKMEVQRGLSGSLPADQQAASLLLTASYTDLGSAVIEPLTARDRVRLRHPAMEAEHFHAHAGNRVLNSESASGGSFIGAITAGSHLRFDQMDLQDMERVSLRVSSAGEGGFIELRQGKLDGTLLARTEVIPNGAWEDWYEIELPLEASSGKSSLFVLFVNPKGGGGLMNLDRITFLRPNQELNELLPTEQQDGYTGKVFVGYQGWFRAHGDGSNMGWHHYAKGGRFEPGSCTIDLWPDLSEFPSDERYVTTFRHADGRAAETFSSAHPQTVQRHFAWMRDYSIDAALVQRFGVRLRRSDWMASWNAVLRNAQLAAQHTEREWALMYDLSGMRGDELVGLAQDWSELQEALAIHEDSSYLRHRGKPVLAIWGIGFNDGRAYSFADCEALVDALLASSNPPSLMLGVPFFYRERKRDAIDDDRLHRILAKADVVSGWSVGRYAEPEAVQSWVEEHWSANAAWCSSRELRDLPVLFPGFSWHNLKGGDAKLGQIPRLGGRFYWSQFLSAQKAGADAVYIAMFDEIDEATAIMKCTNDPPVGASSFLDFEGLPSDHYLWLTQLGRALLRGEQSSPEFPTRTAAATQPPK